MYKGLIFDLDGTLIDSLKDLADSTNKALLKFNLPPHKEADYKKMVGDGIQKLIQRALPKDKKHLEAEVLKEFKQNYEENSLKYTEVYPYMMEVLNSLSQKGYPLAICTNKYEAEAKNIAKHFFGDYIFDIVVGDTPGTKKKPDPEKVLKIANMWDIEPKDIIYLGDSDVDMQTGKNAQMYTIGVLWGFRDEEELIQNGADKIIKSPLEILDLVK